MITAYAKNAGAVTTAQLAVGDTIPAGTVWVDLMNPTEEERLFVLSSLAIDLPDAAEMEEIEASSRLYVESGTIFLTCAILVGGETTEGELDDLTFAISPTYLVTTRYCAPKSIDLFAFRLRKNPEFLNSSYDTFLELMDAIIDRTADLLQLISARVDDISAEVFKIAPTTQVQRGSKPTRAERKSAKKLKNRQGERSGKDTETHLTQMLRGIGRSGNLTHKLRASVNSLNRLLAFTGVQLMGRFGHEQSARLKTLNRDLQSLLEVSNAMTNEISFLLDATLGFINIEQNTIIKIFSIAAVIFLPPTLVGTIYGMNFQHMPELSYNFGYPLALVLMFISALLPVWYFRRRGWF